MTSSTSIIAYVGNGVVKAGLVIHEKNKKPKVISSRKRVLKYVIDRNREQIETMILSEFDSLMKEIKTMDFPKLNCPSPSTALIVISSPWYISETNIIKMKEAEPFMVTESLLDKATSNIVKAYTSDKSDVSVLEQNFLSVNLNGYETTKPIGKKANELNISVFTSYIKTSSFNKMKSIIESNFHLHKVFVHSQTIVSYSAISDIYPNVGDYALIDITSAITEILVVKNNVLSESASFPMGRYFLMDSIAKYMNISPEIAESTIDTYMSGKLESNMVSQIESALKQTEKEWLDKLSYVLKNMGPSVSLPKNFYLFSPHDISVIFKNFIESDEYKQRTISEGKFEVKIIDKPDTLSLCDIDTNAISSVDISIIVGALFNNKKLFS